jgi:predicted MFS family arabinose efflux permease
MTTVATTLERLRSTIADRAAGGATDELQRRVTVVLLATVALDYADRSLVGGAAPTLKHAFAISNTQLGLLASAFSVVGAIATVPVGTLTDRVRRMSLLSWSIVGWAAAMALAGSAWTFAFLVTARLALGALTATGGPTTISLVGDAFPEGARARALGVIESGELIGSGVGLLLAGVAVALVSWRLGFWALGVLGAAVALWVRRSPEPRRRSGGERLSMPDAMRFVLSVRTNLLVLASDSLGNFFFAGVRTFAVVYTVDRFGLSQAQAVPLLAIVGVGAVAGVVGGGWLSDRLQRRGVRGAPIGVASGGYCIAAVVLLPAFLVPQLWLALPMFALGAMFLAAPAPALGAVRLDVILPRIWGRAEAVRTLLRVVVEASAPLVFGVLADRLASNKADGVQRAFLVTLPCVVGAGLVIIAALRSYPRDRVARD